MARRGSKKDLSQRHEEAVAEAYGGYRSPSSGAAVTDEGDVKVTIDGTLFECKGKFGKLTGAAEVRSELLRQFEKIADEAYEVSKEPVLALRFHAPESILATNDGYVDLVVRLMDDDAHRVWQLYYRDCKEQGRWH